MEDQGAYYTGTSGLLLPVPNKQFFPPEFKDKSRLNYYGFLFNSLEVNSSFYKVPMASTVQKWAEDVPEGFKFTFKLWRGITHNKGLAFDPEAVSRFMKVIDPAGSKKGCLLVQFPPGIRAAARKPFEQLMVHILDADPYRTWKIAVEFRHASWYQESVYNWLQERQLALVLHDKTGSATPVVEQWAEFVYLRFHGPDGDYKGTYAEDLLAEYAAYIREWQIEGKDVYVYFNNTIGDAIANLNTLRAFLEK